MPLEYEDVQSGAKVVAADQAMLAKIKAVDPDGIETAKLVADVEAAIKAKEAGGDIAAVAGNIIGAAKRLATKLGVGLSVALALGLSGCVAPAKQAAEAAIIVRTENIAANAVKTIDLLQNQHEQQVVEHQGDLLTWQLQTIERAATDQKSTPKEIIGATMKSVGVRDEKVALARRQNADVKATLEQVIANDLHQAYQLNTISKAYNEARVDPLKLIQNLKAKITGEQK